MWEQDGKHLLYGRFIEYRGIWRVPIAGGEPRLTKEMDPEMKDLYLQGLDSGRDGTPLMLFLYKYTGELFALEPPAR